MKHLSILGSTGSIGVNALSIAAMFPQRFSVKALAAKNNVRLLARQIRQFSPELVAVYDEESASALRSLIDDNRTAVLYGEQGYRLAATLQSVDLVISAMVGAAGLPPTLAAVEAGKTIGLANKETLVMAGDIVMDKARSRRVDILPIDSEHSAIFQCIAGNRGDEPEKVILTGSGGPFLNRSKDDFKTITPADALNHPTWQMGKKISIDSATLMNKGLEIIEAKYLFNLPREKIEVLIHPQSIIHSMVAYQDGSVIAQLGIPDMKTAIAYAMSFPERLQLEQALPDFASIGMFTFEAPDMEKFRCLQLAVDACRQGGTLPAVLNAANEAAVEAFLAEKISFSAIADVIETVMSRHVLIQRPLLADILKADQWARESAAGVINRSGR